MTAIVLVHGAWGGSYGFRDVRPLLRAAGHEVFTPSLTGIGERSHLGGAHVDLSVHITDVRNMIFCEDLEDITLVGFSYGGMVITGLIEHMAARVRNLVFLDAFVPDDGECAADLFGGIETVTAMSSDGLIPPMPRELETPEATAWSNERRMAQPLATLTEAVQLTTPLEDLACTRTFIKATAEPGEKPDSGFWRGANRAKESNRWDYYEIDTHHMVPFSRPEELAGILTGIAGS